MEHRQDDGTEVRENVATGHNVAVGRTEEKQTVNENAEDIKPIRG